MDLWRRWQRCFSPSVAQWLPTNSTTGKSSIPVYWQRRHNGGNSIPVCCILTDGFVASTTTLIFSFSRAVATHYNRTTDSTTVVFQYTGNISIPVSCNLTDGFVASMTTLLFSFSRAVATCRQRLRLDSSSWFTLWYKNEKGEKKKRNH